MYPILKQILFLLPPELAHAFTVRMLKLSLSIPFLGSWLRSSWKSPKGSVSKELFGLHFPNPVGLAAGFDKDGTYLHAMAALGFGFLEIGTVTPKPQLGNPKPRLFRLPKDHALINRMGFNNHGVDKMVNRLKAGKPKGIVIGGNIGKNKITPNEEAVNDYENAFRKLFPYVDYFVVNVSSPNTPNLRALQEKEPLTQLLVHLQELNQQQAAPKPILLKIAPDLSESQLDEIIEIVQQTKLAGIIATNTTISRDGLSISAQKVEKIGAGGLSGQPLRERSTEVIRYIYNKSHGKLPIIGVGGISSPEDALEKIKAGASLVQIYSGLVYEGPTLARNINRALLQEHPPIVPVPGP